MKPYASLFVSKFFTGPNDRQRKGFCCSPDNFLAGSSRSFIAGSAESYALANLVAVVIFFAANEEQG
jgi:hypothetical protein